MLILTALRRGVSACLTYAQGLRAKVMAKLTSMVETVSKWKNAVKRGDLFLHAHDESQLVVATEPPTQSVPSSHVSSASKGLLESTKTKSGLRSFIQMSSQQAPLSRAQIDRNHLVLAAQHAELRRKSSAALRKLTGEEGTALLLRTLPVFAQLQARAETSTAAELRTWLHAQGTVRDDVQEVIELIKASDILTVEFKGGYEVWAGLGFFGSAELSVLATLSVTRIVQILINFLVLLGGDSAAKTKAGLALRAIVVNLVHAVTAKTDELAAAKLQEGMDAEITALAPSTSSFFFKQRGQQQAALAPADLALHLDNVEAALQKELDVIDDLARRQ